MRDNNENMIELIDVVKENDFFFSRIQHQIDNETLKLKFGILSKDYSKLKRILEFRPFENTGVAKYRYFFTGAYRKDSDDEQIGFIKVRVEQLKLHKQYEFKISKKYISNILWFYNITDKNELTELIEK